MPKRTRLSKDIGKSVQRERLKKVTKALGQPPVTVSVAGTMVSVQIPDRLPLNMQSLIGMMRILREKADAVSDGVGENWYPVGFAHLEVDGNSPLVKLFKTEGVLTRNGLYEIAGIGRIMKGDGGYWLSLEFPQRNATEQQSLNYQTPMYQLAQQVLARMGVSASLHTRVD